MGVSVCVLQRDIDDPDVLEEDLLPFRETPAHWEYKAPGDVRTVPGKLRPHSVAATGDKYVVQPLEGGAPVALAGVHVRSRELTVWRYPPPSRSTEAAGANP
jgi:hypothetical protein